MSEHQVFITDIPPSSPGRPRMLPWQAMCSCGWTSGGHLDKKTAKSWGINHVRSHASTNADFEAEQAEDAWHTRTYGTP